jgi:hypothetical protein
MYPPRWPGAHSSNNLITGLTTPFLRSSDTGAPDVQYERRAIPSSDNNALIGVDIAGHLTANMPLRALNLHSGPDDATAGASTKRCKPAATVGDGGGRRPMANLIVLAAHPAALATAS